jgi:aspartyl protease family protein
MDGDTTARLIYLMLLAAAIGGWAFTEMRGQLSQSLRYVLIWVFILVGLVAGYGLWNDVERGLVRQGQTANGEQIVLPRARDGHFYVDLSIDNRLVTFLVDTGATAMVLTKEDAAHLGFDLNALTFSGQASTANGIVQTASVSLDKVALGPYTDVDFSADVNDGDLDTSLLGMSYLSLYKLTIEDDEMILTR